MEDGLLAWSPDIAETYNLSEEVYHFYAAFQDFENLLFSTLCRPTDNTGRFPKQIKPLALQCLAGRKSAEEIRDLYRSAVQMLESYREANSGPAPQLVEQYPTAHHFVRRMQIERKLMIRDQNWHVAKIFMLNKNHLGYFIPIITAVRKVIDDRGGLESILKCKESIKQDGTRLYSNMCNGT